MEQFVVAESWVMPSDMRNIWCGPEICRGPAVAYALYKASLLAGKTIFVWCEQGVGDELRGKDLNLIAKAKAERRYGKNRMH